ncbi:MAG TPA: hypothetical protein VLE23_10660 [Geminicoccaceae bacterium]|nr:hypothetical protein [Geminicoccaceae bacterium]
MRTVAGIAVLGAAMTVPGAAEAGHEMPIYPSYYPQEIRIEPVDPAEAGRALAEGRIHAYVGEIAGLPAGAEETVDFVESLGSFVLVRVNPDSPRAVDAEVRCALAAQAVAALERDQDDFRFHPYPVNPLHADYLHHFDLAARAKERFGEPPAASTDRLTVRAGGTLAERLVPERWTPAAEDWDVAVEEIGLDDLIAASRFDFLGWMGPPWLKAGWFHAWLLLAPTLPDPALRERAAAAFLRLQRGDYRSTVERINLERDLLGLLTADCGTTVAGYGVQRWYYNADYSAGVENIGYDSHAGLRSAIFIRTVKLKDFPWNGWLTLGVPEAPAAAWNPLGGFSDPAGRLIWLTLGDPALFPEPYGALWSVNRIGDVGRAAR